MKAFPLKTIFIYLSPIIIFGALMAYGLNQDAQFVPTPLLGKLAPIFQTQTLSNVPYNLQDDLGKSWIILNFWSTQCIVCREEIPQWIKLSTEPKIKVLSISIQDNPQNLSSYVKDFHINYPILLDLSGKISLDYGVYGTPETFIIDPKGYVRHRVAGMISSQAIIPFLSWLETQDSIEPMKIHKYFQSLLRSMG